MPKSKLVPIKKPVEQPVKKQPTPQEQIESLEKDLADCDNLLAVLKNKLPAIEADHEHGYDDYLNQQVDEIYDEAPIKDGRLVETALKSKDPPPESERVRASWKRIGHLKARAERERGAIVTRIQWLKDQIKEEEKDKYAKHVYDTMPKFIEAWKVVEDIFNKLKIYASHIINDRRYGDRIAKFSDRQEWVIQVATSNLTADSVPSLTIPKLLESIARYEGSPLYRASPAVWRSSEKGLFDPFPGQQKALEKMSEEDIADRILQKLKEPEGLLSGPHGNLLKGD